MLGDLRKAQEVFNTTLREAAVRAAQGELPKESFWLFREARWRCLEASKMDLQPESLQIDEHDNAMDCQTCILIDADNNIIISHNPEHLIATVGLSDMIVVHTPDVTLVCPKRDA